MTWYEWLLWKYERYMDARKCRKGGHILADPEYGADGNYHYRCVRCPKRITVDKVVLSVVDDDRSLSSRRINGHQSLFMANRYAGGNHHRNAHNGMDQEVTMSYQDDTIDWQEVRDIDAWLDSQVGPMYHAQPLAQDWARVAKVSEEVGEAINELILFTGQNPRKGTDLEAYERLLKELADVVATGILAIQHFTKDESLTRFIIKRKIGAIYERVGR